MAKFEKGKPKTGGRKKGTPNKKTQILTEILEEKGFCVVTNKLRIYKKALNNFKNDRSDFRFKYLEIADSVPKDLMQYVYPKRKSIEVTGAEGQPLSFVALVQECSGDEPGRSEQ